MPSPFPLAYFGHVLAVFVDIAFMIDELVAEGLLYVGRSCAEARHPVDDVSHQMEPVEIVQDHHVERCRRCPLFLVTAYVKISVVRPTIGQSMDEPGITVVSK